MFILYKDLANNNGKRQIDDADNSKNFKKFKRRKLLKQVKKVTRPAPVYSEQSHPAQLLNELHKKIEFTFDVDTSQMARVRFICRVKIEHKLDNLDHTFTFEGDGLSKKDAKKKCCIIALMNLYGETYKPPNEVITSLLDSPAKEDTKKEPILDESTQLQKRIQKLCTRGALQTKSPSQLLYEICKTISNTGECVGENGKLAGKKYTFQFRNVLNGSDSAYGVVYGFGANKKEAKNDAAKQALRMFLNCDLDTLAIN